MRVAPHRTTRGAGSAGSRLHRVLGVLTLGHFCPHRTRCRVCGIPLLLSVVAAVYLLNGPGDPAAWWSKPPDDFTAPTAADRLRSVYSRLRRLPARAPGCASLATKPPSPSLPPLGAHAAGVRASCWSALWPAAAMRWMGHSAFFGST